MRKAFSRRILLRGLGGAVVAAPFLSSIAERTARTQGMSVTAPKRLIVLFTYNGCITNRWFPSKSHGRLTTAAYGAMRTLAPLAPYADKLLMVRGIRAMNEWSFEGTLGQLNDPHTQVCGSYFTCHPVTPNAPYASASNLGKFDAKPTGRSLDHVCAEQVNARGAPPLFLQIGGVTGSTNNTQMVISYNQPEQIFPGYGSPKQVLASLTNLFGSGSLSPDSFLAVRRKSVIDCVRDDLDRLMSVNMSTSDRRQLADWVDLLNETSKPIIAQCNADTATRLGLTNDAVETAGDLSKTAPLMLDLAVLAATCDSNRVIFMKMPPSYKFTFLGVNYDTMGLAHRTGSGALTGACIPDPINTIHTIDSWYAQQFAYLVGRLDSMREGDRTLLDNSATVWFQEFSDGAAQNVNNLPILQAGSCGDYFKTGWAINVENARDNMTAGNSDPDCPDGQTPPIDQLDRLGTPPGVATQPINKYYCNLMNAIGVRAGPDGFPTTGGTEPVARYGKYDDTTLFKTDAPPIIKNPGEYSELRAS